MLAILNKRLVTPNQILPFCSYFIPYMFSETNTFLVVGEFMCHRAINSSLFK